MKQPVKASPELWELAEKFAENKTDFARCIIELRDRVEALEVEQEQPEPIDEEENDRRFHASMDLIRNATPEQIRAAAGLPEHSSLVMRVAGRFNDGNGDDENARAVIREVAAWLEDEDTDIGMGTAGNIVERLREEAER